MLAPVRGAQAMERWGSCGQFHIWHGWLSGTTFVPPLPSPSAQVWFPANAALMSCPSPQQPPAPLPDLGSVRPRAAWDWEVLLHPGGSCLWVLGGSGLSQLGLQGEPKVWLGCSVPWGRFFSPSEERASFAQSCHQSVNSEG